MIRSSASRSHWAQRAALVVLGTLGVHALACTAEDAPPPDTPQGGAPTAAGGQSLSGGGAAGSSKAGAPPAGNSSAGSSGGGASGSGGAAQGGAAQGGAAQGGAAEGGAAGGDYWRPEAGLSWQSQLSEPIGTPLEVDVYDIDWESDSDVVSDLQRRGIKVICYVSVGSWEDFRPDAGDFPPSVIGNDYDGWPGEKYVDIRSPELRAIMQRRFDVCRDKGFDAIEPDNQDVYDLGDESGFPLTRQDGLEYARWLADEAHARGMSIGQKNAPGLTADIVNLYDWALTESCYSDGNWCGDLRAYADAGKPVFMCEYEEASFAAACEAWRSKGYSPILKNLDLDAAITRCP